MFSRQAASTTSSFFFVAPVTKDESMSFLPRCVLATEASQSLRKYGAAFLAREGSWALDEHVLDALFTWCEKCDYDQAQAANWDAWKVADRQMNTTAEKDWNRFSMNANSNWHDAAWISVVRELIRGGVLAFVQTELGIDARITRLGGDTVRFACKIGQHLHSDGGSVSSVPGALRLPREEVDACPYLVLSICVHDIHKDMAPFYFAGLDAMYGVDGSIPALYTPEAFDEHFGFEQGVTGSCVMKKGDMFLRNPLVWHAGTPNLSSTTRYFPACIFSEDAVMQKHRMNRRHDDVAIVEASQTVER